LCPPMRFLRERFEGTGDGGHVSGEQTVRAERVVQNRRSYAKTNHYVAVGRAHFVSV